MTGRTRATILTELAEVERHLRDAPPHHGAGVRDDLERRRDALRRELSRSAATDGAGPSGSGFGGASGDW